MASGIYALRNTVSGGFYIGSSTNIPARLRNHRSTLTRGVHDNPRLQASWNKYGPAAFVFEPICFSEPADVLATEQRLLDKLVSHPRCYNLATLVNGGAPVPESRQRMREAQLGRKHPPEVRAKIAAGNRQPKSPEARARMSAAKKGRPSPHTGKRMSDEGRANIRAGAVGRKRPPGKPHTAESRAKMSAAKMGNTHALGHTLSIEARAKISAARRATTARGV